MKPVLAMSSPPYDGAFLHLQVVRRLAQWFFLVLKGIYNFALPLTSTPFSKQLNSMHICDHVHCLARRCYSINTTDCNLDA